MFTDMHMIICLCLPPAPWSVATGDGGLAFQVAVSPRGKPTRSHVASYIIIHKIILSH